MKHSHGALTAFCLILGMVLISGDCPKHPERETVLDKVVYIEKSLITEIPPAPRWCDKLDPEKKRVSVGDCELYGEEKEMDVSWPDFMRDLGQVHAVGVELDGKTYILRMDLQGSAHQGIRAAVVCLFHAAVEQVDCALGVSGNIGVVSH